MADSLPRRLKLCKHCGEPESAHHEFAAQMPPGCQCAPGEWGDYVLDVCRRGSFRAPCYGALRSRGASASSAAARS